MNRLIHRTASGIALAFIGLASMSFFASPAYATYNVLHNFFDKSVPNDGANPRGGLTVGPDGNYYGTCYDGGSAAAGAIYRMNQNGAVTIIHSFGDGTVASDGKNPACRLRMGMDGNWYGSTQNGGFYGMGTVFKMTPLGKVTILHSFGDPRTLNDGAGPEAEIISDANGNFYSTTGQGGKAGNGTFFMMSPLGKVTVLHSFGAGTVANDGVGSWYTTCPGPDGNFYGTTYGGGSTGLGTVYRITHSGQVTILHSFGTGTDGQNPYCALILASDGYFYGTTQNGGPRGFGTVYKISPGGAYGVIHNFDQNVTPNDGVYPIDPLIECSDGNLYGTAYYGGSANSGCVYRITKAGAVTVIHSFADGSFKNDGIYPFGPLLLGPNANLWGTCYAGGTVGAGTVFEMFGGFKPSPPANAVAQPLNSQISLTWSPSSSGAMWYNVYRGTTPGGESSTPIAEGQTTMSFTDVELTNGETYYYKVAAVNNAGTSAMSNETSATPYFQVFGPTNLLAFQNSTTNQVALWRMSGLKLVSSALISQTPQANYHVVGVGDFNGDGQPDLVFQNKVNGTVVVWYLNGSTVIGSDTIAVGVTSDWNVVGVGDFDGDRHADSVFQNATTGKIAIWMMHGIFVWKSGNTLQTPAAGYKIVGVGDFNGDGYSDLLFQSTSTGRLVIWNMQEFGEVSATNVTSLPAAGEAVVSVTNLLGHAEPDVVMVKPGATAINVWSFAAEQESSAGTVSAALPAGWNIVGPK